MAEPDGTVVIRPPDLQLRAEVAAREGSSNHYGFISSVSTLPEQLSSSGFLAAGSTKLRVAERPEALSLAT